MLKLQWPAQRMRAKMPSPIYGSDPLHDCRYPPGAGGSAGGDGDEKLHQALVDVAGGGGLDNENIFVADRLADGEGGFLVRVVEGDGSSNVDSETVEGQLELEIVMLDAAHCATGDARYRICCKKSIPLRNLLAELGVAPSADELDLVRHFAGHVVEKSEDPSR